MKINALIGASSLLLLSSIANAATIGFTEGSRPQVAATTSLPDTGSPGPELGTVNATTSLAVYGRVVSATDYFQFSSKSAFTIDWLFGGYDLDNGGSVSDSGLTFNPSAFRVDFTLINVTADEEVGYATFSSAITSGDKNIFLAPPFSAGDYRLEIKGFGSSSDAALYDVAVTAVPLPAAAWLFGSALVGAGLVIPLPTTLSCAPLGIESEHEIRRAL